MIYSVSNFIEIIWVVEINRAESCSLNHFAFNWYKQHTIILKTMNFLNALHFFTTRPAMKRRGTCCFYTSKTTGRSLHVTAFKRSDFPITHVKSFSSTAQVPRHRAGCSLAPGSGGQAVRRATVTGAHLTNESLTFIWWFSEAPNWHAAGVTVATVVWQ